MEEYGLYSSAQERDRRAVVNMVLSLSVSQTAGSVLTLFIGVGCCCFSYHHCRYRHLRVLQQSRLRFVFWAVPPCNLVCGLQQVFEEHIAAAFKVEVFFLGGGRMSSEILVLRYKTTRCRNSAEHRTVAPANSTDSTPTSFFIFAQNIIIIINMFMKN